MGNSARLSYIVNGKEQSRAIGGSSFRIGRDPDSDLPIDNPYVSRNHAEITRDRGVYQLRDLDSTSGTYVNGQQMKTHRLEEGDCIRLGRGHGVELLFHLDEAPETRPEKAEAEDSGSKLTPVRVVTPEETRFINTARLPKSGELTRETVDRLRSLYEFTTELLSAESSRDLSEKLAVFLARTLQAERCAVLLHERDRDSLKVIASSETGAQIAPSRRITRMSFDDNVAVLSLDARSDERFAEGASVRFQSIRSVMCAPMGSKTRVWGVCYVDNLTSDRSFDDESLEFLAAVARQGGLAMENLFLLEEQRRSLESFIRTLAASLDARDDNTAGHSARVAAVAAGLARVMGLNAADVRVTYYAGLLHDYGKIGIRDDVLLKPAELTTEEYEHIKEHPVHTFKLLSKIRFPEDLADIPSVAAPHHERWDGSGYPEGLSGEDIPIGSRIIAVADAYDALTEQRCYNEPMSPARALVELTMRSGTYFDPSVIKAFVQYYTREIEPRNRAIENQNPTLQETQQRSNEEVLEENAILH
ncbi:MAG TPA: HD domain-containing phosphohydrolase [Blastocatellia bacterium]|nr:HD domain-containing phosphohydrolase [Blastocatellia bacterium]